MRGYCQRSHAPIIIVGGGPVGSVLALGLARHGLSSLILERQENPPIKTSSTVGQLDDAPSARTIALSFGSRLLLEQLGIWAYLAPNQPNLVSSLTPITQIEVSEQNRHGRDALARLVAWEQGLPALGYTVSYGVLQKACWSALQNEGSGLINIRFASQVQAITATQTYAAVNVQTVGVNEMLTTPLAVVADGGGMRSPEGSDQAQDYFTYYPQTAVFAQVEASGSEPGLACARFTRRGPVALLPIAHGNRYTVIRTIPHAAKSSLLANDEVFLSELQADLGDRVGTLHLMASKTFAPLSLRYSRSVQGLRTIKIGNAAQTLHPIAGQGLNLGLRDAWQLAEALSQSADPGLAVTLSNYVAHRRADRWLGIQFTHRLVQLFGHPHLGYWRRQGLNALDACTPLKKQLTHQLIFGA